MDHALEPTAQVPCKRKGKLKGEENKIYHQEEGNDIIFRNLPFNNHLLKWMHAPFINHYKHGKSGEKTEAGCMRFLLAA